MRLIERVFRAFIAPLTEGFHATRKNVMPNPGFRGVRQDKTPGGRGSEVSDSNARRNHGRRGFWKRR